MPFVWAMPAFAVGIGSCWFAFYFWVLGDKGVVGVVFSGWFHMLFVASSAFGPSVASVFRYATLSLATHLRAIPADYPCNLPLLTILADWHSFTPIRLSLFANPTLRMHLVYAAPHRLCLTSPL